MVDAVVLFVTVSVPLVVIVVLLGRNAYRVFTAPRLEGSALRARRRAIAATVLALAGAGAYVAFSPVPADAAIRTATMPALAALVGVIIAGLAELTYPRPQGERREASVVVRRGTAVRRLGRLLVAGLVANAVLLPIAVITAGPTGRSLERHAAEGRRYAGPYPGMPYAVPIALALTALALATWWSLRRVDGRPALGPGLEEVDRAIRIAGRVRVLRLAAGGSLVTAAGVSLAMGWALVRMVPRVPTPWGHTSPPVWDWAQSAAFGLIGVGIAFGVAGLAALLSPSPRVPEPASDRLAAEARQ